MTTNPSFPGLVYCDDDLLVVNKPAGLLAVPGRGVDKQDSLSTRMLYVFPDALVVHRLDMATSGLMLFARSAEIQRNLSMLFQERKVEKCYVAIVSGRLETGSGEVNLPIAADWPNRPLQRIDIVSGKPSLTRYRVLSLEQTFPDSTRVELSPVTGRTHQLRVHMAALGHPIIGDTLYGNALEATRMMLHASRIRFTNLLTGRQYHFCSKADF